MSERFCKDCKHYRRKWFSDGRCASPKIPRDKVTGALPTRYAEVVRELTNWCGPQADWFERKGA